MKKRTYIQPEVETAIYYSEGIMLPESPTGGGMDPNPAPAKREKWLW